MVFDTLRVNMDGNVVYAAIDRKEQRNSINCQLIRDLTQLLDAIEREPEIKMLVISGGNGVFCTGMDFEEAVSNRSPSKEHFSEYMTLLKRFTITSKILVAKIEGQVLAGGIGVAAACDLVLATPNSQFCLPEVLWGLVPAMVMPFLIRRVGPQPAYRMALTTETLSGEEAGRLGLVDVVDLNLDAALKRISRRLLRLDSGAVENLKCFVRDMWIINGRMEELAVSESFRIGSSPEVRKNLERFIKYKQFPWE